MDERVREHAETLVEWSARIDAGDDVVVSVAEGAHDLAVAVAAELGERGANVVTTYAADEVQRAYLRGHEGDFEADPAFELSLYEGADSVLILGGSRNTTALADVEGDRRAEYRRARRGIREARLDTDWVSTLHPTRAGAQQAGMAYEEYQAFLYRAVLRDWASLAEEMARLKERLDDADEARIVKSREGLPDTDLTMAVEDRVAVNSAASIAYGSHNLPSGEVFTAPVAERVEGTVAFDVPMTVDDASMRDVVLSFEAGEVVEYRAAQGEDALADVVETDEGSRRLGELGVGMNRGIDRPTGDVLFDEKMAGTVHLALGRAYDACLPAGEAGNDSAVHQDFITDMGGDVVGADVESRLELDGETVQRNGTFVWAEDFEDE